MKRISAILPLAVAALTFAAVIPATAPASASNVFEQVAEIPTETPQSVAIDSKNNLLYVADGGRGSISRYDLASNALVGTPLVLGGSPVFLAVDSERDRAFSVDPINQTITVINTATFSPMGAPAPLGSAPKSIVVNANTGLVYLATYSLDRVTIFDPAASSTRMMSVSLQPTGLDVDESTNTLYVTGFDRVSVFDLTSETEKYPPVRVGTQPSAVAVDDSTHEVFVVNSMDNTLTTFDGLSGSSTGPTIPVPVRVRGRLVVDVVEHRIYAATTSPEALWVWDARSRAQVPSDLGQGGSNYLARDVRTGLIYLSDIGSDRVRVVRDGSGVVRVGGVDRYEVSATNSRTTFAPAIGKVYVASGETYPDALAAAAAAGAQQGVVLLTMKDTLPNSVRVELARLRPQTIVVVGGTATISTEVETALAAFSTNVTRISGPNRFDVSAFIAHSAFGAGVDAAYVATGENFPDALSAAAAAGATKSPVLLVMRDAVPESVDAELRNLEPNRIVVVGGPNSVSDGVLATLNTIAPAERVGGVDRFDVTAKVSRKAFSGGSGVTYMASGTVFADALSASATAIANGSPVLLLPADGIPSPVQDELTRLSPRRIVIVGGPATVSDATATALRPFVGR